MRTTLQLDDATVEAAKRHARATGTTLTAVIDTALKRYLANERRKTKPFRLELITRDAGAQPGVDLEDRSSLYDLMESQ